jgi:hypothetical protein
MKKRSFLLPLTVSLAVLAAGADVGNAKPVTPTNLSLSTEVSVLATPTPVEPLVLKRANSANDVLYARHGSHSSHASHASHASHYSSR